MCVCVCVYVCVCVCVLGGGGGALRLVLMGKILHFTFLLLLSKQYLICVILIKFKSTSKPLDVATHP